MSALAPETVEIAAALARHSTQGRDLRISVIAWFLEADQVTVPEPPGPAVALALAWAARVASPFWLLQRVRTAVVAAQQSHTSRPDEAHCTPSPSISLDLVALREELVANKDSLAAHLRVDDPSLEAFTRAFSDLLAAAGLFPFLTAQQWYEAIAAAQIPAACIGPFAALGTQGALRPAPCP